MVNLKSCFLSRFLILAGWLIWVNPIWAAEITNTEEWMGIYFKGKKLGFSKMVVQKLGNRIQVDSRVYFRLRAGGSDQVTSFTQETVLDSDLQLQSFFLLQEIMGNRHQTRGRLEGGNLIMDVSSTGYQKQERLPFQPGTVMSSSFILNIRKKGLGVGRKGRHQIFMEALRTFSKIEYEIQGKHIIPFEDRLVETYVIHQRIAGMESTLWITPEGVVLREASQDGFESIKETESKARDMGEDSISVSSMITLSLVKSEKEIELPAKKRRLKVQLLNLRTRNAIPEDQRQKLLGTQPFGDKAYSATLLIETEPHAVLDSRFVRYFPDPSLLSDTSEIQSKHPMIQALAHEIISNESNAWQAAQGINEWVYHNLDKVLVDTFTAMDALQQRKGECQAHTNLYVALARAAGIPARVVNGLVYSPEYKGFVYHAWPEVFVGDWRALDPTFGQNSVDATHIKLGKGGQEAPLRLMEFIGKLQIRVLSEAKFTEKARK